MQEPTWKNDNKVRIWNNALAITLYSSIMIGVAGLFLAGFALNTDNYILLIAGIVFLFFIYELVVNSYIRITYLNGNLEFYKTLRKYSLLFRKRNHRIEICPDEWTEVYCRSHNEVKSFYFRQDRTAAYFVTAEWLNLFYADLEILFPKRFKRWPEPLGEIKRKLKKTAPDRVV